MKETISAVAALLFIVGVAVGTLMWAFHFWGTPQPVAFNHKKHTDFGIACAACHVGAKDSAHATIPNVQTCALCHVPGKATLKTPADLEEYIRQRRDIPWKRIYKAAPHVRFSHKRHTAMAGIDCRTCHGDIASIEGPVTRQPVALNMTNCMSCHRKERISTNCLTCHR
ncbi:MAG: cytochrome c3 family protein [Elusimicrobia bacterium]|nr:cytochrome c3 family protein [Elusimicrobiota bacterium]